MNEVRNKLLHVRTSAHQHWGRASSFPLAAHEMGPVTHFWPGTGTSAVDQGDFPCMGAQEAPGQSP